MVNALSQDDVDLAICGYNIFNHEDKLVKSFIPDENMMNGFEIISDSLEYQQTNTSLWNKIFKLQKILDNEIEFDCGISIGEDMLFLISYCLKINKVKVISEILYNYYENPSGAILGFNNDKNFNSKWFSEWIAILQVERMLSSNENFDNPIRIKKVRIAEKLVSRMVAFNYKDESRYSTFKQTLKENRLLAIRNIHIGNKKK